MCQRSVDTIRLLADADQALPHPIDRPGKHTTRERRTEANWFLFDFIDNTNCSALRRRREPGGGDKSPGYFFLFFFFHSHLKLGKHRCP